MCTDWECRKRIKTCELHGIFDALQMAEVTTVVPMNRLRVVQSLCTAEEQKIEHRTCACRRVERRVDGAGRVR